MVKILLIVQKYNMRIEPDYNYLFPIGMGYIFVVLKKAGYDVKCLNMNHHHGTIEKVIDDELDKQKYDYVGLGSNALDYALIDNMIRVLRKHPTKPKIILGGPIITTDPALVFNALKPDYGVIGEGEDTIVELMGRLKDGGSLKDVKGIIYRKDRKVIQTAPRPEITDLDSIPFPNYEEMGLEEQLDNTHNNYSIYATLNKSKPRIYPILCSRSCPFQCTFCYHLGRYRKRSLDNIMTEIRYAVKKYKITVLMIYDDCFSTDKQQLKDFCREIQKIRKSVDWELSWICQLRVNTVDDETVKMLKASGCCMISYGLESYSPIVLRSMRKYITPEQIDHALKITLKNKVGVQANFIFGDIAETAQTASETLKYWRENCEGQVFLVLIQPYPDSVIYRHCLKKGLIKDKLKFMKEEIVAFDKNMTDAMTEKEFSQLKHDIYMSSSEQERFIIPRLKKKEKNIYAAKVTCPFCKSKNTYDDCEIESRLNYGFGAVCRRCYKRFRIVSLLQYIVYKKARFVIGAYVRMRKMMRMRKLA